MSKKFLSLVLTIFFIAVLATYISGDYESMASQIWNLVPPLLATICGVFAVKVYSVDNPHAKAIAFMSLGIFFWFIGDFIWFIFEYFLNKNPFPSIADYFYLLAYPLLLVGLLIELKSNKLTWSVKKIAICALLAVLLGSMVLYLGVVRAYDPTDLLINNIIAIAYGIGDLILILFAVAILMVAVGYRYGKLFVPWLCILVGFFLILNADVLFAMYREEYENYMGLVRNLDIGWISGYLFIAYGFYAIGDAVESGQKKLLGGQKL